MYKEEDTNNYCFEVGFANNCVTCRRTGGSLYAVQCNNCFAQTNIEAHDRLVIKKKEKENE